MKENELWQNLVTEIIKQYKPIAELYDEDKVIKKIASKMHDSNYGISYTGHDEAREFFIKVMEYMNELKGGNPFPTRYPSSTSKLILERKKDGYTIEDVMAVILKKSAWLKDDKMKTFFRPATIFQKTKFENYIGELDAATGEPGGKQKRTGEGGNSINKFTRSLAAAQGTTLGGSTGE